MSSAEEFLRAYWPGRPAIAHGPVERLAALSSLPELSDLPHLVSVFTDPVSAILPDERDESSAVKVDGRAALELYQDGHALLFSSVDRFIPTVNVWLHRLRAELGLPSATYARALVYAARPGAGNKPHYDANANIVVQLKGVKRWTIAPNTHVVNPTDRWTMTSDYVPSEVSGSDVAMPRQMPDDAEVIDLQPGSVLLVPRGYWHATEVATDDTLALNFTFSQPTWAEVLTAVLLHRLHRSTDFRGLADGLESPSPHRQRAAGVELSAMLEKLKVEVEALTVDAVLAELAASRGP